MYVTIIIERLEEEKKIEGDQVSHRAREEDRGRSSFVQSERGR